MCVSRWTLLDAASGGSATARATPGVAPATASAAARASEEASFFTSGPAYPRPPDSEPLASARRPLAEQRPEVVDRVRFGRILVGPVALDAGEAQRDAAGIARRRVHAFERNLDDELRSYEHGDAASLALALEQLMRLPLEQLVGQ